MFIYMIDLTQQHCGVRQASFGKMIELMPDLRSIFHETPFPDFHSEFSWDVKVHMLMPRQYPCIPNWHTDNVPRENGVQRFEKNTPQYPMWMWVSNAPLTQFKHGYVKPRAWHRFTQLDEHRGTYASENCWRMFIRATHEKIRPPRDGDNLRRHCQVYLDAETYQW